MLDAMAQLYPEQYSFYPRAWYLPQQFVELCEYASRQHRHNGKKTVFIVKPDDGTQGEGIYLLTDPYQYQFNGRNYIVQEYIANPLLLDGLKFDLRVYVVLTQLKPLTIYMCRWGWCAVVFFDILFPLLVLISSLLFLLLLFALERAWQGSVRCPIRRRQRSTCTSHTCI